MKYFISALAAIFLIVIIREIAAVPKEYRHLMYKGLILTVVMILLLHWCGRIDGVA